MPLERDLLSGRFNLTQLSDLIWELLLGMLRSFHPGPCYHILEYSRSPWAVLPRVDWRFLAMSTHEHGSG